MNIYKIVGTEKEAKGRYKREALYRMSLAEGRVVTWGEVRRCKYEKKGRKKNVQT